VKSDSRQTARSYTIPKKLKAFDRVKALQWVQGKLKIQLAENQKQAVKEAIEKKVMVVTGGPALERRHNH